MKFTLEQPRNLILIQGYGPDYFRIGGIDYTQPLLVTPQKAPEIWSAPSALTAWSAPESTANAVICKLLALGSEIILIGSGSRWQAPPTTLLQRCAAAGVGLEVMDSGAACRTYNLLASEGRRVATVLLLAGSAHTSL